MTDIATFLIACAFAIALVLAVTTPTRAHDFWSNGEEVPAWVKHYCCSKDDVHRVKREHVHVTAKGYRVDGLDQIIAYEDVKQSEDGEYWGFWFVYDDGHIGKVWCFFAPPPAL